jgi:CheY-like chemotaxis protein
MEILSQSYPESNSLPIIKSVFLRAAWLSRESGTNTMTRRISSESKDEMSDRSHAEILVVDDDALSRRLLAQLLTAAGYKCRVCKDGSEALEIVHARPPSLLLLDFDMPGLNGAEVLTRLRSDHNPAVAQIPVIMLTAHGSEESEVSCLRAGADDFVTKPVNAAVLRARIETQLRLRSMRRQLERQNDELENWRRDLERDLAAARLTQQSLIPQKPPALPGWEVATCYRPVIQVGGDIYGWLRMTDGRILFWIADGTGHGAAHDSGKTSFSPRQRGTRHTSQRNGSGEPRFLQHFWRPLLYDSDVRRSRSFDGTRKYRRRRASSSFNCTPHRRHRDDRFCRAAVRPSGICGTYRNDCHSKTGRHFPPLHRRFVRLKEGQRVASESTIPGENTRSFCAQRRGAPRANIGGDSAI